MTPHRHYPRELVLSALYQTVVVKVHDVWPVELAATAGVAQTRAVVRVAAKTVLAAADVQAEVVPVVH